MICALYKQTLTYLKLHGINGTKFVSSSEMEQFLGTFPKTPSKELESRGTSRVDHAMITLRVLILSIGCISQPDFESYASLNPKP